MVKKFDFCFLVGLDLQRLQYIIKAPNPQSHLSNYQNISEDNPIRKIIDEYKSGDYQDSARGKKLKVYYSPSDHAGSMKRMFEQKLGVCRHRVAAVVYKLVESEIESENYRAVRINNNHIGLEIRENADKPWVYVDLGGGLAKTIETEGNFTGEEINNENSDDQPEQTETNQIEVNQTDVLLQPTNQQINQEQAQAQAQARQLKAEINQLKTKALQLMQENLKIAELNEINDSEDLQAEINKPLNKNILLIANNPKTLEQNANYLISQAKKQDRLVFYIDKKDKIDLNRINLLIEEQKVPTLSAKKGMLANFLNATTENNLTINKIVNLPPLLIINWDAFSSKEKVALNSVLDTDKKINGVAIDNSVQIIGLSQNISQDPSFLSRHNLAIKLQLPNLAKFSAEETKEAMPDQKEIIDLQGFTDWKRHLFGKIILQGEQMVWQKSDFVKMLGGKKNNFELINLSDKAKEEFQQEFNQAKAYGYFTYHNYKISLPENIQINYGNHTFDFNNFDKSKIAIARNVTLDQVPENCPIINSYLFDLLLTDKQIDDKTGQYYEQAGLLEKHKTQSLKLFISDNLSKEQFYCLFRQAQKNNVNLNLYLSPSVKIPINNPQEINLKPQPTSEPNPPIETTSLSATQIPKKTSQIFISNNPEKILQEDFIQEQEIFAIIDVEDFSYQDLIEKITFETNEDGFKNFTKTESEFLSKLKEGKKIILKGQFAFDLLKVLEPLLTSQEPQFAGVGENLILIIEEKDCQSNQIYQPLAWLGEKNYQVKNYQIENSPPANKDQADEPNFAQQKLELLEENPQTTISENSEAKAQEFITRRKKSLTDSLQENSMARLIGHSGVGKSRLIKEFENNDQATVKIYRELSSFEDWAKDQSDKTKILFIDESNIEDRHFTMFSPLKNNPKNGSDKQNIFYQGKFYNLDQRHKVVFAGNPLDYGGGRFEQKLFDDSKIPAIYLRDFSADYIYENILKKGIYELLSLEIKEQISLDKFKVECGGLIKNYQDINVAKKKPEDANQETVRELQEKTLQFISNQIAKEDNPEIILPEFISTDATRQVEKALILALDIRKNQRQGHFPAKAVGLNGVLLEGDSGVGKSALIAAIFKNKGIEAGKLNEEENSNQQKFYKIEANLPLEEKKRIISKAFVEGNIIWIDEINACVDDGLEKYLNAALTGEHPEGGDNNSTKPGFMLISSINSAALEGRSIISPALKHRTIQPRVKSLKEYSENDLAKIIKHWLTNIEQEKSENDQKNAQQSQQYSEKLCQNIAKHFKKLLDDQKAGDLNLRSLKSKLTIILPKYLELEEKEKDLASQNVKPSNNPQNINAVSLEVEEFIKKIIPSETVNISKQNTNLADNLNNLATKQGLSKNLQLIHPKFIVNNQDLNTSQKFDYSIVGEQEAGNGEIENKVMKTLNNLISEIQITPLQATKIILMAIKNGGTKNTANLRQDLEKMSDDNLDVNKITKFSGRFEKEMKKCFIFTGNQDAKKLVGMRLKRLTPDYALKVLKLDKTLAENHEQTFKGLCDSIGINQDNVFQPIVAHQRAVEAQR